MKKYLLPALLSLGLPLAAAGESHPDPYQPPAMPSYEDLLKERTAHRKEMEDFMAKMRAAGSPEERSKLMDEHAKQMEAEMERMSGMPPMPEPPPRPAFDEPPMPPFMEDAPPGPEAMEKLMEERNAHMKRMQEYQEKIEQAQDPAERRKLIQEQTQAMREHMDKMRGMGGPGMGRMMGYPPRGAAPYGPTPYGAAPYGAGQPPYGAGPHGRRMPPGQGRGGYRALEQRISELEKKLAELEKKGAAE